MSTGTIDPDEWCSATAGIAEITRGVPGAGAPVSGVVTELCPSGLVLVGVELDAVGSGGRVPFCGR